MPEEKPYESLAVNTLVYQRCYTDQRDEKNACHNLLDSIKEDQEGIYAHLRNNDRMISIVAELAEYAN